MYGAFSYGSIPYGDGGGVEPFDVDAMLSASREELVYTVELTVWGVGGDDAIDRTTGTNIGNLTGNAGLSAAFDGITSQGVGASAARGGNTGYVGKTLAVPSAIDRVVVHGSNNFGYAFATNAATTINLYGKVGAAPASATDGTLIGGIAFTDTSNESVGREIQCTDKSVMYDHVWVVITSSGEGTAVYCAELVIYRSRASTIRLGSAEWATAPTDVPASQPFDERLTTVLQWSRSIIGDRLGIDYQSGEATIAFLNGDGAYDDIVDGYTIDGREVVVRVGRKSDPFADHHVIFRGVGVDWSADTDTVTVTARDKGFLLDVPAQPNVYAGTGDAEGGGDLTGKRKPLVFGQAQGVEPVLVDSIRYIYQVSDRPFNLSFALDRGVSLSDGTQHASYADLKAATVTPGTSDEYDVGGFVRLGATPDGLVTVNGTAGTSVIDPRTAADLVRAIIDHSGALVDADLDEASLDALLVEQTATAGLYIGPDNPATVADAINGLMAGIGGWAGFDRQGKFAVGIFYAPAGDAVASFSRAEGDIIDLNREKLPSGVWPPPWRWRVASSNNETVFTDFGGSVMNTIREAYAQPYQTHTADDPSILDDHPSAQDPPPVEARFMSGLAATNEADRLLSLYSSGYRLYRMTLDRRALLLNLGDLIAVTWPRFGLDAGKLMRIVAIDDRIDLSNGSGVETIEVTAFG